MSEPIAAIMRSPSGWREPAYHEEQVTILGFTYGKHLYAGGYDKEVTLAIVQRISGPLCAVPLHWITVAPPNHKSREGGE